MVIVLLNRAFLWGAGSDQILKGLHTNAIYGFLNIMFSDSG